MTAISDRGRGGRVNSKDSKYTWTPLLMERRVLSSLIYLLHCDIYYDEIFSKNVSTVNYIKSSLKQSLVMYAYTLIFSNFNLNLKVKVSQKNYFQFCCCCSI
jgi:hypothetical protein